MYRFSMDQERGVLTCITEGFWDIPMANRYWDEIEGYVRRCHRDYGRFTFLLDATRHQTQTPEVQAVSERRSAVMLQQPENRVAIVVVSSLLKRQARRVIASDQLGLFLSREAAETWLYAWLPKTPQIANH